MQNLHKPWFIYRSGRSFKIESSFKDYHSTGSAGIAVRACNDYVQLTTCIKSVAFLHDYAQYEITLFYFLGEGAPKREFFPGTKPRLCKQISSSISSNLCLFIGMVLGYSVMKMQIQAMYLVYDDKYLIFLVS